MPSGMIKKEREEMAKKREDIAIQMWNDYLDWHRIRVGLSTSLNTTPLS
jgi:hypothetical protein